MGKRGGTGSGGMGDSVCSEILTLLLTDGMMSGKWSTKLHLNLKDDINHGFPGGSVIKNLPAMQETWIPGSRRPLGEGNGNPLHYSCLGNSMNRGVWRAIVLGVIKESRHD